MLTTTCLRELRDSWFPNVTDEALDRLIDLIDHGSPLLVHGCFTKAIPMGCIATHIAWHHPRTRHLTQDAGIFWLTRVAKLNPATSAVIREWDARGPGDWELRTDLLAALRAEREARQNELTDSELLTV